MNRSLQVEGKNIFFKRVEKTSEANLPASRRSLRSRKFLGAPYPLKILFSVFALNKYNEIENKKMPIFFWFIKINPSSAII